MKRARRIGAEDSTTRTDILDATEKLMLAEGYAAVTTRRVAKQIGLTPALVHYYFPTTDDLLVAAYRRAVDRTVSDLQKALSSAHPLQAIWEFSMDATCTALALEFMALANHRKSIRAELVRSSEAYRTLQTQALGKLPTKGQPKTTALGVTALMAGVSRLLVLEKTLGISLGHAEARAMIEDWIGRTVRQSAGSRLKKKSPATRVTGRKARQTNR